MGKNKLKRFAELDTFPHVFQRSYDEADAQLFPLKGKWHSDYFKNDRPIVLELGCGKGDYTIGLAKRDSLRNFIGVDLKGARLWRGGKTALEEDMKNVAFLRANIEKITSFFAPGEVSEIWITFPDPRLKDRHVNKRLTAPCFLNLYAQVLRKQGIIHLKTDCFPLYAYSLGVASGMECNLIDYTQDLYNHDRVGEATEIQTFYEARYRAKGDKICYLTFNLPNRIPLN